MVVDGALARRYESQRERLCEAAINYADAGDDDLAYRRAWDRLRNAAIDYVLDGEELTPRAPKVPTLSAMRASVVGRRVRAVSAMQLRLL